MAINNNEKKTNQKNPIGFSTKNKKAAAREEVAGEKLTRKQIIILVAVLLLAVTISGTIIGTVIIVKKVNNPDFMNSNLSRYVSISEEDYKGYDINIPLDVYSEAGVQRKIDMLLTSHKVLNEEYKGRYPINDPLALGNNVEIYYRGYTVGEDGRENDFEGSSNFADSITLLEVGTGNLINAETKAVSGSFIAGFGESLVDIVPGEYSAFSRITSGRVMTGDVIYLSYTVIGGNGEVNKIVKNERIDLSLPYIDEIYGTGFTDFFVGTVKNGEPKDFKTIDDDIKDNFICRIGNAETETIYSDMKVEFVTRGCENNPIPISVRFPANYSEKSLRGKDAFFDVYVQSASVWDVPEYDDKFITETLKIDASELSGYNGETLAEKYRDKVREEYKTELEESNHEVLLEAMWAHILDKVEVKKIPKKTLESYYNSYYNTVDSYYGYYSQSYESIDTFAIDYLNSSFGAGLKSGDDWKAYITSLAEADVVQNLTFYYIIREEGFIPTDEEYREIYDKLYNEILDYYLELHDDEFSKLSGEEYDKELAVLKSEIDATYGDAYFKERTYAYYGTRKMLALANIKNASTCKYN